jgi:hypothetical protein
LTVSAPENRRSVRRSAAIAAPSAVPSSSSEVSIRPTYADIRNVRAAKMITFTAPCRNGHQATYTYSALELRELLQTASLRFHCDTCIATRPPTAAETMTLTQRVLRSESESV